MRENASFVGRLISTKGALHCVLVFSLLTLELPHFCGSVCENYCAVLNVYLYVHVLKMVPSEEYRSDLRL